MFCKISVFQDCMTSWQKSQAPEMLYYVIFGSEPPFHPECKAFILGFSMKCQNGFSFLEASNYSFILKIPPLPASRFQRPLRVGVKPSSASSEHQQFLAMIVLGIISPSHDHHHLSLMSCRQLQVLTSHSIPCLQPFYRV